MILRVREEIGGIVRRCSTGVPGVHRTTRTWKLGKYLLCANGSSSQGDNPNPTTTLKTDENQNKIAILVGTTFHKAYTMSSCSVDVMEGPSRKAGLPVMVEGLVTLNVSGHAATTLVLQVNLKLQPNFGALSLM